MKTYLSELIPRLQRFSKELDDKTLLTSQHWILIDDETDAKTVYIFRPNSELLIATNGNVHKATWEYLGQNSILINDNDGSHLFRHGFLDEKILALCLDGTRAYAFMVNEKYYDTNINSSKKISDFLQNNYLPASSHSNVESSSHVAVEVQQTEEEMSNFGIFIAFVVITMIIIFFAVRMNKVQEGGSSSANVTAPSPNTYPLNDRKSETEQVDWSEVAKKYAESSKSRPQAETKKKPLKPFVCSNCDNYRVYFTNLAWQTEYDFTTRQDKEVLTEVSILNKTQSNLSWVSFRWKVVDAANIPVDSGTGMMENLNVSPDLAVKRSLSFLYSLERRKNQKIIFEIIAINE
jgi:hypothetical protein